MHTHRVKQFHVFTYRIPKQVHSRENTQKSWKVEAVQILPSTEVEKKYFELMYPMSFETLQTSSILHNTQHNMFNIKICTKNTVILPVSNELSTTQILVSLPEKQKTKKQNKTKQRTLIYIWKRIKWSGFHSPLHEENLAGKEFCVSLD